MASEFLPITYSLSGLKNDPFKGVFPKQWWPIMRFMFKRRKEDLPYTWRARRNDRNRHITLWNTISTSPGWIRIQAIAYWHIDANYYDAKKNRKDQQYRSMVKRATRWWREKGGGW